MSTEGAFSNPTVQQQQQPPPQQRQGHVANAAAAVFNRPSPAIRQHSSPPVAAASAVPLQYPYPHQQQHHQSLPQHPQSLQQQPPYWSAGSMVEISVQMTGESIAKAEVLMHDPVADYIMVRTPARSGRPNLFDIRFFNLTNHAKVRLISLSESLPASPEIDLKKVESRLHRNLSLAEAGVGASQAAAASAGSSYPPSSASSSRQHQQQQVPPRP